MTTVSIVEILLWLLIAASAITVVAQRLKIPYTVALVLGGLVISSLHFVALAPLRPLLRPHWLTPDVILILFLPALVFEGSLKLNLPDLMRDWVPLLLLANVGVVLATLVTGYFVHWSVGIPLMVALIFGSVISATDPISVLALFETLRTEKRLSVLVEGESLLNDGTAVVLFQLLLAGFLGGGLNWAKGAGQFVLAVTGGAGIGFAAAYLVTKINRAVDDPQIEITLTTVAAYGSYLLAYHFRLSGVIASGAAGLFIGNYCVERGVSRQTRSALESYWEYIAFVMNSLVFLLIGLEVRIKTLAAAWLPILLAIVAVLLGRALTIYFLVPASNAFAKKISFPWQHVMMWGGLRGALALALAVSLDEGFPYRELILNMTFGVVVFSILVQGLTMKPLMKRLGLAHETPQA